MNKVPDEKLSEVQLQILNYLFDRLKPVPLDEVAEQTKQTRAAAAQSANELRLIGCLEFSADSSGVTISDRGRRILINRKEGNT